MKYLHDILIGPVVTEKSTHLRKKEEQYVFEVRVDANKIEIRKAIEAAFPGIYVADVNTMRVRGKVKRQGRTSGRRPMRKKAIVTLFDDSREFTELKDAGS